MRSPESGRRDDGGYVAILVAIALPLFVVLAALAVDVANWYAQAQRVQQAADAAASAASTTNSGSAIATRIAT